MRPPSSSWLKEIGVFRNRLTDDTYSIPSYPWLAPPLHSRIRSLIERWGVETELGANEPVLGHVSDKVDKLVMVKSGITGRCFGSIYGVKQPGMAFSIPGRLACGNLNFFSHRPCVGSYYALVPSVVISVPQSLLYSLLGVEDRLLAYFITWTVAFGREEIIDGISWIRVPAPLRGEALQFVVNCSAAALERALGNLKSSGNYIPQNDSALIKLECMLPVHRWLRNIEERSSDLYRNPLKKILAETHPE